MTRWITWLVVLSVCGGMLLCSGWTERSTAWADKGGGCGEDEDGNPNLLTIYHSSGDLVPDDEEDEGTGAVTQAASDGSKDTYVRLDVCVPKAGGGGDGGNAERGLGLNVPVGEEKIELFESPGEEPIDPEELTGIGSALTL